MRVERADGWEIEYSIEVDESWKGSRKVINSQKLTVTLWHPVQKFKMIIENPVDATLWCGTDGNLAFEWNAHENEVRMEEKE